MLQRADTNGDGQVTRAEFSAARDKMFTRLDRNGDGYLSKDDSSHRLAARRDGSADRLADAMATLDKDKDGRISKTEFVNGPSPLFDRADTNHDGTIDAHELQAFSTASASRQAQ
jgi:Ca2+-binding EF-hand superfamily protein